MNKEIKTEKEKKKIRKIPRIICDIRKCKYKSKNEYYCNKNNQEKNLAGPLTMQQLRSGYCIWE